MDQKEEGILCTFVIPIYIKEENIEKLGFFKLAMQSIFEQTCSDWSVVLVDDHSENRLLDEMVNDMVGEQKQSIIYHQNKSNMGPGVSRNIAIDIAYHSGSDAILFLDQDDLAHPDRVRVTRRIFEEEGIDVIYSPFVPVDENGIEITPEDLPRPIKGILDNYDDPPVGKDVWKALFNKTLFINFPCCTSVRIEYAKEVPFPDRMSSEDAYTWLMYSVHGAVFDCVREIPSKYRLPSYVDISSSRDWIGQRKFLQEFCDVFIEAFFECSKYALEKGTATKEELDQMEAKLYLNLVLSLKVEGMHDMATDLYRKHMRSNR